MTYFYLRVLVCEYLLLLTVGARTPGAGVEVVRSCPMWVLRTEFSSACPLKSSEYSYLLSQMSPAPEFFFFIFYLSALVSHGHSWLSSCVFVKVACLEARGKLITGFV